MSTSDSLKWIKTINTKITKDDFKNLNGKPPSVDEIKYFVNLWLTEGVPFAFEKAPYLYQQIRQKIANKLDISSRAISLIGSARIGFSLSPQKDYKDYNWETSDLDFFIVSQNYFNLIKEETQAWLDSDNISPQATTIRRQTEKGFLDTVNIDNTKHDTTRKINTAITNIDCWLKNLKIISFNVPTIKPRGGKGLGVRIYNNWESAVEQNTITIDELIKNQLLLVKAQ